MLQLCAYSIWLPSRKGIDGGLSDLCVLISSSLVNARALKGIFGASSSGVRLCNFGPSRTCLLIAVTGDCVGGVLTPCVQPEQN